MADLRAELSAIYNRHQQLTAPLVVEEARSPESPLHSHFEWDDSIAGEKYRLAQAGELIRSVRVVFKDNNGDRQEVREWFSVTRASERTYVPVEKVVEDPISLQLVLQEMERDIESLKRKYGHLQEFAEAVRAIRV